MKLLRLLFTYARPQVLLAMITGAASGLATTALLGILNRAIGRIGEDGIGELTLAFLGLAVLAAVARIVSGYTLDRFGQQAVFELRTSLSRSILATPLSQLEAIGSHRLMTALTNDINAVSGAVRQISTLSINATIVVGGLAYLGWLSGKLLLLLLCLLPLGVLTYWAPGRAAMKHQRHTRELADVLVESYQGVTDGTKELQLNRSRRLAFLRRLEETGMLFQQLRVRLLSLLRIAGTWGQLLFFLLVGALVFVLPPWLGLGREVITGAALALLYVANAIQGILDRLPDLTQASVSVDKVEKLGLSLARASQDQGGEPLRPAAARASLELRGVRYGHPADDGQAGFAVGPVDLRLVPGETVFLTGGNGSGKTTLAKLIAGLYAPSGGEILLDGRVVADSDREIHRQHVSAVFSDFHLFRELLGFEHTPELKRALGENLERLELSSKVRVEGGEFSTLKLSQGQRKRLALVVATLEDRPIVLFDEWAADQDPQFKEFFYYDFLAQLKARHKTVVVISHDDRYYGVADRVVKLDGGLIQEEVVPGAGGVASALDSRLLNPRAGGAAPLYQGGI